SQKQKTANISLKSNSTHAWQVYGFLAPLGKESESRVKPLFRGEGRRRTQRRRWILRQLLAGAVRALDLQFAKEYRRRNNGAGQRLGAVIDIDVISGSNNITAQGAGIKLLEDCAADQFHVAVIYINAPQQARRKLRPGGLNIIAVRPALVFAHLNQPLLQIAKRNAVGGLEDEVGNTWTRRPGQRGTTVAVGVRKIADGFASQQIVGEYALIDHSDRL